MLQNSIMAIRDFITSHIEFVLDKSRLSPSEELHRELNETVATRVRELLLQMFKLGFEVRALCSVVGHSSVTCQCFIQWRDGTRNKRRNDEESFSYRSIGYFTENIYVFVVKYPIVKCFC